MKFMHKQSYINQIYIQFLFTNTKRMREIPFNNVFNISHKII